MQCAEQIRREVMDAELLKHDRGGGHDVCARGLVLTLPISPQTPPEHWTYSRENIFVPGRVYRAVSLFRAPSVCVGALTVPTSWFCNRAAAV